MFFFLVAFTFFPLILFFASVLTWGWSCSGSSSSLHKFEMAVPLTAFFASFLFYHWYFNIFAQCLAVTSPITWLVHSHSLNHLLLVLMNPIILSCISPANLFLMVLGYTFKLLFISCFLKECYEERIVWFCNLHSRTLFCMISLLNTNKYSGPAHCLWLGRKW